MSESQGYYTHSFNSTRGYPSLPGINILFLFPPLHLVPFPYGFSFMFVLCFNFALGSTLEWASLCKMIGGWAAARDSWSLRNSLGVWNTLTATALKVPWCSWRSHAAFDTPSSFNILFDIWDVDIFLSAFPEMNLFHLLIIIFFLFLSDALESY